MEYLIQNTFSKMGYLKHLAADPLEEQTQLFGFDLLFDGAASGSSEFTSAILPS